jgi:hypothetical protein
LILFSMLNSIEFPLYIMYICLLLCKCLLIQLQLQCLHLLIIFRCHFFLDPFIVSFHSHQFISHFIIIRLILILYFLTFLYLFMHFFNFSLFVS